MKFQTVACCLTAIILCIAVTGCSSIGYVAANAPTLFGSYHRVTGLRYGTDAREQLDVYMPVASGPHPLVIFWYGGSWQSGRRSDYRFVGAALAERGFVTVIPDYRLYPPIRFPKLIDDGAMAVAWAR